MIVVISISFRRYFDFLFSFHFLFLYRHGVDDYYLFSLVYFQRVTLAN